MSRLVAGVVTEDSREKVDCGIVLVTYNSALHIERLLDSLPRAAGGLRTRCVVVDNNSRDSTLSIVHLRNDVEAVQAGGNLGYSGGINLARSVIGPCSALLILNPDLVLEANSALYLYQALEESGVGVAVPTLLNNDNTIFCSLRREPSLLSALGDALFGAHWPSRPRWLSDTIRDSQEYTRAHDVEWASGAAMLISTACHDAVGDWDATRFFLYSEETDFSARARGCGFRIRYVPTARGWHEAGGSGRSPELYALMTVNRIRYYEKYHGRLRSAMFRAIIVLQHILRIRDPHLRGTLRVVLKRSSWAQLPRGDARDDLAVAL